MKIPEHIRVNVAASELKGHRLVSQGAALFRCTLCDHTKFLDTGPFVNECPLDPAHPAYKRST